MTRPFDSLKCIEVFRNLLKIIYVPNVPFKLAMQRISNWHNRVAGAQKFPQGSINNRKS